MRFFSDMRIRDKIFDGHLLTILAGVGVAVVSWQYLTATDQRFEQAVGHDVPEILVLGHLRDKAAALIHAVDAYASRTAVNQLRTGSSGLAAGERRALQDAERDLAGFLAAFAGDLRTAAVDVGDARKQILTAGNALLGVPKTLVTRAQS